MSSLVSRLGFEAGQAPSIVRNEVLIYASGGGGLLTSMYTWISAQSLTT